MNKDSCFQLGFITKTHGLDGHVHLVIDSDYPEDYENLESVFIDINESLVPFFITSCELKANKARLKFDNVGSLDEASDLKGKAVFLPLDELPELGPDQFYYHEIIGFDVIHEEKVLAKIKKVYEYPHQDVLAFDVEDKEILLPVKDEFILEVNKVDKYLKVIFPDGLFELYMNQA